MPKRTVFHFRVHVNYVIDYFSCDPPTIRFCYCIIQELYVMEINRIALLTKGFLQGYDSFIVMDL